MSASAPAANLTTAKQRVKLRKTKPWAKMFTPAQMDAIMAEYDSGVHTATLCKKYGMSRSWLFRTRKRYLDGLDPGESVTFLRAEIARLERVIVQMAKVKLAPEIDAP